MRRRQKKRETLGVSLFPFLAVLICTLGVLIVLLVIAVKSADVNSIQAQAEEDQQFESQQRELEELQFSYEIRMAKIEGLKQVRPEAVSRLADIRSHRGHLEEEIRQLKRRAGELGEQLLSLSKEPPVKVDLIETEEQIESLKQEILLAQAALKKKRNEAKRTGPTTYSIVPHAGSGGTFRRPIFIECTANELVIQPLGIRLPKSEFTPPLQPGNMLDAALLANREYWQRYDVSGDEGSPYPLLVIRPDGAETYVLARRAMKSWDDEFGYELVEADKKLAFGEKDEQLIQVVTEAVEDARTRQRLIASRRSFRSQQAGGPGSGMDGNHLSSKSQTHGPGLSASGSMGGFVSNSDWKTGSHQLANEIAQTGGYQTGSDRRDNNGLQSPTSSAQGQSATGDNHGSRTSSIGSNQAGTSSSMSNQASTQLSQSATSFSSQSLYPNASLAKERGKNWALPSQTPGAVGYVRPIRVICRSDELEIRSSMGHEKTI